jgi:Protein of unknown function (DUF2806)
MGMSEGGWALIDLKGLSAVANNLINKVSKAIGVLHEPRQVKKIAKAKAEARVIDAQADEEITDIQRRAIARRRYEDEREQENLEAIVKGAIPHLSDKGKPEELDDDWLADFFERAKRVSDKDMQTLWAKILAGQANAPGSFRKNALQIVSLLEKEDADLFVNVCRFGFHIGDFNPAIFDLNADIYSKCGLGFTQISHLDDIGLITFDNVGLFEKIGVPLKFQISYAGRAYNVSMPEGRAKLPFGHVLLTQVGRQLAPLSNAPAIPEFPDYAIGEWKKYGIVVEPV